MHAITSFMDDRKLVQLVASIGAILHTLTPVEASSTWSQKKSTIRQATMSMELQIESNEALQTF